MEAAERRREAEVMRVELEEQFWKQEREDAMAEFRLSDPETILSRMLVEHLAKMSVPELRMAMAMHSTRWPRSPTWSG